MKARLTLHNMRHNKILVKTFDWKDIVMTGTGRRMVKVLSVFDDVLIIDGLIYNINYMLSFKEKDIK